MQRLLDFPIRQTFDATLVAYCGRIEELCHYAGEGGGEGEVGWHPCLLLPQMDPLKHYNPEIWCQTHNCKLELKYETWFGATQELSCRDQQRWCQNAIL